MNDEHQRGHPQEMATDRVAAERREMLAHVDRFIAKHYGVRCRQVIGGCPRCAAWAARDALSASIFE